ncbi:hypothetical protein DM02DRAFT_53291 [Periconia macrospinosa]|uniref:Uncharacterized protein n=1 Tax=Periconia macrospinosa TaxID=97972 RepID=A0A2V1E9D0_9PLEO|nr:hypothetical protein DM02DRAFT_53291 [Periconia macrospinosa]
MMPILQTRRKKQTRRRYPPHDPPHDPPHVLLRALHRAHLHDLHRVRLRDHLRGPCPSSSSFLLLRDLAASSSSSPRTKTPCLPSTSPSSYPSCRLSPCHPCPCHPCPCPSPSSPRAPILFLILILVLVFFLFLILAFFIFVLFLFLLFFWLRVLGVGWRRASVISNRGAARYPAWRIRIVVLLGRRWVRVGGRILLMLLLLLLVVRRILTPGGTIRMLLVWRCAGWRVLMLPVLLLSVLLTVWWMLLLLLLSIGLLRVLPLWRGASTPVVIVRRHGCGVCLLVYLASELEAGERLQAFEAKL